MMMLPFPRPTAVTIAVTCAGRDSQFATRGIVRSTRGGKLLHRCCGKSCTLSLKRRRHFSWNYNSIVIVSLHSPKEKVWGELLAINPSGITVRGVDLNSFDHFIRQINEPDGERMGLPTIFFPMNRLERISLDEPSGSIPSMDELFARKIGRSLTDYLAQFA